VSLCVATRARPEHVRAFLEVWRPAVDEIVLAQDERADPDVIPACADLADQVAVVPAAMHMERYLGWLHAQCSCDWILRADDDELPSSELLVRLPDLVAEREPTHYWLARRWVHPTPAEYIAEGVWGADIQVRLIRNLPGLWCFEGKLHSNVTVLGASRVADAPLLHLVLLMSSLEERCAKVMLYERLTPGLRHESGRPLNDVFVPEDAPPLRHELLGQDDQRRVAGFMERRVVPAPRHAVEAARVARPSVSDLNRWLGDRPVSTGAYRAHVRLVHDLPAMAAEGVRHVQVEVTNLGDDCWPRGPDPKPQIAVGHRWRRPGGSLLETATPRTAFTETVAPGATTRLTVAIQAPPESGKFELLVDVVHEWVRWFDCPATQVVTVTSPYADGRLDVHREGSRRSAHVVLPLIFALLPVTSLIDVGCGTGSWLRAAMDLGIDDVAGVDGPWIEPAELDIPPERYMSADLTMPVTLGRRFDVALALEVAEHLPPEAAEGFVRTLVDAAPVVAFSAAIPGQGGVAHLNEQWPAYWVERFARHGYEAVDCIRPSVWNDERVDWWYAQNLLLFAEPGALEGNQRLRDHPRRGETPLPLVHPRSGLPPKPEASARETLTDRIERLDTSLFGVIESQTTEPDRRSLLALHAAVADRGPFEYLEIGSHLGGSLQVLIADPRCIRVISIDTRPQSQQDDRGGIYYYQGNNTDRMVAMLLGVPDADLTKLTIFERGTGSLSPEELPGTPFFCLIDAEHTRQAALRDARFCLSAVGDAGLIVFHDSNVVEPAIDEFLATLAGREYAAFRLPDSLFVVELGSNAIATSRFVRDAGARTAIGAAVAGGS
jgi:hypothetical protein